MDGAVPRELSIRQRRFAAEIASGQSRAQAYMRAYPNQHMKKGTLETEAKKAAKHPKVRAEVARLSLELLPPVRDMRAAYDHAFSTILKLTLDDNSDGRLRFDCARWLRSEYERQQQLAAEALPAPAEDALAVLRTLYHEIEASAAANPLMLDVEREGHTKETVTEPMAAEEVADATLAKNASDAECRVPEETRTKPESGPIFSKEPVPGRFPPAYQRVRVR
jgi:hypothetical protein